MSIIVWISFSLLFITKDSFRLLKRKKENVFEKIWIINLFFSVLTFQESKSRICIYLFSEKTYERKHKYSVYQKRLDGFRQRKENWKSWSLFGGISKEYCISNLFRTAIKAKLNCRQLDHVYEKLKEYPALDNRGRALFQQINACPHTAKLI